MDSKNDESNGKAAPFNEMGNKNHNNMYQQNIAAPFNEMGNINNMYPTNMSEQKV